MGDLHHASADDLLELMGRVATGTSLHRRLEAAIADAAGGTTSGSPDQGVPAAAHEASGRLRLAADLLDIPHPVEALVGEDAEDVLALASLRPRVLERLKTACGEPKSAVFDE